jgi:glycosyltransferase involved in cell wall biosynthesis
MASSIVHVVQRLAPGGLEVLSLELARRLPGHHVIVSLEGVTGDLRRAWPRIDESGVRIFGLDKRPGVSPVLIPKLIRVLRTLEAFVVVTHHAGPFIYGGVAARCSGIKRIIHVEHDVWHYQSKKRRQVMGSVARIVRPTVVCVSAILRPMLQHVFPTCPIWTIANGVDVETFPQDRRAARERIGLTSDQKVIGAVGRLEFVKGHDVLIDAMQWIDDDISLVIVGDGSERPLLEERARNLGISSRVRFLGHQDRVVDLYAAFDVLCQPSRNEGLPLTVLEAQACGVPVIATAVGDMASAVCPSSGFLTSPESPREFAERVAEVFARPTPHSPRQFVSKRFNWAQTLAGYQSVIGV